MASIGIYRSLFPLPSETFISEQARALRRFSPRMLARRYLGGSSLPVITPAPGAWSRLRDLAFAATADPRWFPVGRALEGIQLIHAHFGPDGIYAMRLAQARGIPFLVTFHGFDVTSTDWALASSLRPSSACYLMHRAELKRSGGAFIAVSKFIRSILLEQGFPPERVRLHYIGVDTARFVPAGDPGSRTHLLCVGRHVEKKGIDVLLEAFARVAPRFPRVDLLQVGSGPLTSTLKALAARLGLGDRVRFLGSRPHEEVRRMMQEAYAFVLPSRRAGTGDSEALGIVFLEASACGRPVISTVHGGIPEAVLHGETGLLAAEGDPESLAAHLATLLGDRELADAMGRRGRDYVCGGFDLFRQTEKLEGIYQELLA
jgi:glycosyltransferase involved in cell wall biosynthesis